MSNYSKDRNLSSGHSLAPGRWKPGSKFYLMTIFLLVGSSSPDRREFYTELVQDLHRIIQGAEANLADKTHIMGKVITLHPPKGSTYD